MSSPAGTPQRSWRPSTAVRSAIAGERIELATLLRRRVIFVVGKGGTGRSTMTAALALLGARAGKRILAIDVDAKGDLAAALGSPPAGFAPHVVQHNLSVLELRTDESFQEYLSIYFKVPRLTRLTPLARVFDFIATGVPGPRDMLVVGKIAYEERRKESELASAGLGPDPRRLCRRRAGGVTPRGAEGDAHARPGRPHPRPGRVDRCPDPRFASHHDRALRSPRGDACGRGDRAERAPAQGTRRRRGRMPSEPCGR